MNNKIYGLMNWPDIEEIVYTECSRPDRLLGAHMCQYGMLVQIFRPDAVEVYINVEGRKKNYECDKVDEAGYFAVIIPVKKIVPYKITVELINGNKIVYDDPYYYSGTLSEEDLKNISFGNYEKEYKMMGAHYVSCDGIEGVNFAIWVPEALRVSVIGEFNSWNGKSFQMIKDEQTDIYQLFIPGLKPGTPYMYEIKAKGGKVFTKLDPYAVKCINAQKKLSVVDEDSVFNWTDKKWLSERKSDYQNKPFAVCSLSLSDYGEDYNIKTIVNDVKKSGFDFVEIKDVLQFSHSDKIDEILSYYAISDNAGTVEKFKNLVNAFHMDSIGVVINWNIAFMGMDSEGLYRFNGKEVYETSKVNIKGYEKYNIATFNMNNKRVRNFLISNANMWVDKFHIDGFRVNELESLMYLDYGRGPGEWICNIYGGNENLDAVTFFKELRSTFDKKKLNIMMYAQDSSAWPMVTGKVKESDTSLAFDYKMNSGLKESFIEFITKDPLFRKGYYGKLFNHILYNYCENFMLDLDGITKDDQSILDLIQEPDDEEKIADVKIAIAFMYFYPGKKNIPLKINNMIKKEFITHINKLYHEINAFYEKDAEKEGFEWVISSRADETVFSFMRSGVDKKYLIVFNCTPVHRQDYCMGVNHPGKYKEVFCTVLDKNDEKILSSEEEFMDGWNDSVKFDLHPLSVSVYEYSPFTEVEKKKIAILKEAKVAKEKAVKEALRAIELRDRAEKEAELALEAEKRAKESAKKAIQARETAEKRAKEAELASKRIDEETKKKLENL